MTISKLRLIVTPIALLGLATAVVRADQPFFATATTSGSQVFTVSAGGNNLSDFVSSLVNTKGDFQSLKGFAYTGSIRWLGVANAITVGANTGQTSVTLNFNPIGVNKVFNGSSAQDVDDQIDDYFKKDGLDVMARFLKAISAQSAIAVTDGNPNSATVSAAGNLFMTQGFTPTDEIADGLDNSNSAGPATKPRFGGFAIGFNSGHFKAGAFSGTNTDFSASVLNFGGEQVRFVAGIGASLLDVEGAKVYGATVNFSLPIRFQTMSKDNPYNWRLTPVAGISARASADLGDGALLWQAGLVNTIDYKVAPKLVVCMVNQFTFHKSISLNYDDYSFDPRIDQQMAKNGFRFVTPLTPRVIGDFFVLDTRYLKTAAVKSFETFGASVSLRATKTFNLGLAANYDTGSNYKAWSVGLSSAWHW